MQVMAYRSNGDTSNVERVFLFKDSGATAGTEGDPMTGLTNASTLLNISTIASNEAAPNTDTSAATSSIETVTPTIGTYATPTAGFVRFIEVDATNMPGLYELQWEDARYAVASAIWLDVTISGVADLAPFHGRIYLEPIPVNTTQVSGTAQTANDNGLDINTLITQIGTAGDGLTGIAAVGDVTNLSNLPAIPADWLTAAGTHADFGTEIGLAVWAETTRILTASTNFNDIAPSEIDQALVDIGLDHLISAALPTSWATDVVAGSVFDNVADDGTAVYDRTTDSLQAVRDHATTSKTVIDNLNLGIIYGTAQTGTLSTTVCTSDQAGNFADDELIGRVIVFTGGTADGQAAVITDYANTAGTITFSGGITTVPVNNDTFKIV